jgi:hypothetical protein
MPKLRSVEVSLTLPYVGSVKGTWSPDRTQQSAAWELYVELATRIAVTGLQAGEGSLREALSSLHSLFDTTRDILRRYGQDVAKPTGKGNLSFALLAVTILNSALRPVLAKWHPLLVDYEEKRDPDTSPVAHERRWEQGEELRKSLHDVELTLGEYARILAQVAGIPDIIGESRNKNAQYRG